MKILTLVIFAIVGNCLFAANYSDPYIIPELKRDLDEIKNIANGKLLIGDSNGVGQEQTISGDITISNAGVSAIASGTVVESDLVVPTSDSLMAERTARVTYDVSVDGGEVGAHALGVSLPANSIITRSWFYTVTQFTDGGSGTVALSCEDAGNIYAAADITGNSAGAFVTGVQDDAIGNFTGSIAASCEVTATVATAEQTAGKLILFIRYVVVE
jgi:hypothetical protein